MVSASWRTRREGYRRLGAGRKFRRMRDRHDVEGMPNIHQQRRYSEYLHKSGGIVLPKSNVAQRFARNVREEMPKFLASDVAHYAPHLAKKFMDELERSTIDGVMDEMERALKVVRGRAEKQVGGEIPATRAERDYIIRLKSFVAHQIQQSAVRWRNELRVAVVKMGRQTDVWNALITKEHEAKNDATMAARTLLSSTYNAYMTFLLQKGGGTKFRWINPMDKKTSQSCRNIYKRVYRGVTLDELKEIVRQEAVPGWWKAKSPFSPHPQCRSAVFLVR